MTNDNEIMSQFYTNHCIWTVVHLLIFDLIKSLEEVQQGWTWQNLKHVLVTFSAMVPYFMEMKI